MPLSHRAAAAFLCAIPGFAVILTMRVSIFSGDAVLAVFATIGAAVAGAVTAPLLGRPGREGLALATLAAVSATALGAAIAGFALGLPAGLALQGMLIGPLTVGAALATSPVTLAAWLVTMACAHEGMAQMRRADDLPS
jgi:hypothetical protein